MEAYFESIKLLEPDLEVSCGNCRNDCYMDADCVLLDFMHWSPKEIEMTCTAGKNCPMWGINNQKCLRHSEPCVLYEEDNVKTLNIKEKLDAIVELAEEAQAWYEVLIQVRKEGRQANESWYEVYLDKAVRLAKEIEVENDSI